MATLDELFGDYEAQRAAEIAKDETPEAIARRAAKAADQLAREIRQGLRTADGDWILDESGDDPEDDDSDDDNEDDE